jgi:heptosyltransferase-2
MHFPNAQIDFLVRKGNESLLENNPHLNEVLVWDKKEKKLRNLFYILKKIREKKYDKAINLQRFFATGLLTAFSAAKETIGFDKNPLSFLFTKKIKHIISKSNEIKHEVERNNDLISAFTNQNFILPKLYLSDKNFADVQTYAQQAYVTMTSGSVWFTKQYPIEKWIELISQFPVQYKIYLLGGKENIPECEIIKAKSLNSNVEILAGKLSFLQSSALMKNADMNYVNDSAPLHFASAVNAPVAAIYCSTIPAFGFTPLSDKSFIIETNEMLACRPCGLHGKKACPQQHFKCGFGIATQQLLRIMPD